MIIQPNANNSIDIILADGKKFQIHDAEVSNVNYIIIRKLSDEKMSIDNLDTQNAGLWNNIIKTNSMVKIY